MAIVLLLNFSAEHTFPRAKDARAPRRIARGLLEDKVRGGWAGQMIGVAYGAPTEFMSNGKIIEDNLGDYLRWTPARITNAIKQDDLYVEMTFAAVMDRVGLDATTEQYGEAFKNSKYPLWHANAAARRLLNRGIKAPLSGNPKHNVHANDIDFQIEADFIGLMTPGLPQESNKYCERGGGVMSYGDGLYGGMFIAGMYSVAFFEKNPRRVVEQGLSGIPEQSGYGEIIRDVLGWSKENPDDWKKTWQLIEDKWNKEDSCPGGAHQPLNIDARLNGAYVALGLLYGDGDFKKTLEISTRSGQDSDCNASSVAGILGVMLGFSRIPDEWKSGFAAIAERKFTYTDYSFEDITRSTIARALKIIEKVGGKVTRQEIIIPFQTPQPPRLEQWDMGVQDMLFETNDAAWEWKGEWSSKSGRSDKRGFVGKMTSGEGAETTLQFTGTAMAVIGAHSATGGRADVYLDGKRVGVIESYAAANITDGTLWHTYKLKPGEHTIRIVPREDADSRSQGNSLIIYAAVSYRPR